MEWCGCVLHVYAGVHECISYIFITLPHTTHKHSNVSLNLYYTEDVNVQFSVASCLHYIYKSSSVAFEFMVTFSSQHAYNGSPIP